MRQLEKARNSNQGHLARRVEKGKLSAAQKAMFPLLEAAGIKIFVCRSMIEVDDVLRNCLVPMRSHQWQDRRGLKSTPLAVT